MKECNEKVCEVNKGQCCMRGHGHRNNMCGGGAVYGLGFIGSIIYFISTAPDFWMGVLGILKAIVWPAFMVYEAFKFLIK